MKLSIAQIASASNGSAIGNPDYIVEHLLIDSRSLFKAENTMFCALHTDAADGHRYIYNMYSQGVRAFLVDNMVCDASNFPDAAFVVVKSVEQAIYAIALQARAALDHVKFIAITGSVGKTVIKEQLFQALYGKVRLQRSPRSWNSRLGVALSITELQPGIDYAIIEVGIDRVGDMARLANLVRPTYGIFMPITDEHSSGFDSIEQKTAEKALLFANCSHVISVGSAQLHANALHSPTTQVDTNLQAVEKMAQLIGVTPNSDTFIPSNRIDVREGVNDCVVLFDSFTNDYRSLISALDFMRRRCTPTRSNTVILSNIFGADSATVINLLYRFGINRVITIGSDSYSDIPSTISLQHFVSVEQFIASVDTNQFSSESILIFGRGLRPIKDILAVPRHDSIMEVNLDALIHNFNYYRSLLQSTTGVIAMVKASAYGIGAVEVAKTLQAQGATMLAVAVIEEGIELRRGGISMPIVVLNPVTGNYKALFNNNLEPSVFSMRELATLVNAAQSCGIDSFNAHIKLDTGMHRVGFTEAELPQLITYLKSSAHIRVASIFSHLATADCPDMNDYTELQLTTFHRMSSAIIEALPYPVKRHILNTAGIMRYPEYQYDMVRLGIGLYGVSPLDTMPGDLRPVATLRSTIISIKHWPAGTTIGYARRGKLTRPSVIATIPIGYADGINRHLGRGAASFVVRGIECSTVGNICMDQCMIDITDVPAAAIGDPVEIYGPQMPVQRLAATLDTIPYELLTAVSPRIHRIYFRE